MNFDLGPVMEFIAQQIIYLAPVSGLVTALTNQLKKPLSEAVQEFAYFIALSLSISFISFIDLGWELGMNFWQVLVLGLLVSGGAVGFYTLTKKDE